MLKVLWFTNIPLPAMRFVTAEAHAGTGSWMVALLDPLRKQPGVKLAVACVYPGLTYQKIETDGVEYLCIPQGKARRLFHYTNIDDNPALVNQCAAIVKEWQPDVIHIHGTERFYGMLGVNTGINVPTVISIQGLLTDCCKWRLTFGDLSIWDIISMHRVRNVLRGIGPLWDYRMTLKNARREQNIISGNKYFMGRTDWDYAHVKALNPSAHYYHVDDMLRPEFRRLQWDVNSCRRHSIIFTNARDHRRGADALFRAVVLLKRRFPDILVRLAGVDRFTGVYGSYLSRLAKKEDIYGNIEFLGYINAKTMSQALVSSHVFVLSSLIENGSNSLNEAQTVGLPCVANYTGGVTSMISDGETGFMVPVGDVSMIADRVTRVFENDSLASDMSKRAREIALVRHNPDILTEKYLTVYRDVVELHKKS